MTTITMYDSFFSTYDGIYDMPEVARYGRP